MGSLCSKSSSYQGGHTVLGPGNSGTNPQSPNRLPSTTPPAPPDRRAAAADAAERRMQAAQKRGTTDVNPKAGKLSEQLARQSSLKPSPQGREEERLVWD